MRAQRVVVLAALSLGGCASTCGVSSDSVGANGELGNGEFMYTCGGPNDPACETDGMEPTFPECIVLGGRFQLEYTLRDPSARAEDNIGVFIRVEPGNEDFFAGSDSFQARRPGRSVFLAREDDQVLDMIHLSIVDPMQIRFRKALGTEIDTLEIAEGELALVDVFPDTPECAALGGAISPDLVGGDPSIATATGQASLEITGIGVGTTSFVVRLGELERELSVVVVEGPATGTGTGTGTTDATASSGTGTTDTGGTDGSDTTTTVGTSAGSSDSGSSSSTTGGTTGG